jgi:KDO2-lipid IV(A) lauroyltransferase
MTITFHAPVRHADGPEGLAAMTQGVADAFTVALRRHPEDWHMMPRVFVDDVPPAGDHR